MILAIGTMWTVKISRVKLVQRTLHVAEEKVREMGTVLRWAVKNNVSTQVVNPDKMRCVTNNFDNYPALFVLLLIGQGILDYQAKTL